MNEQKKFFKLLKSNGIKLILEGAIAGLVMAFVFTFKWLF